MLKLTVIEIFSTNDVPEGISKFGGQNIVENWIDGTSNVLENY